MSTASPYAEVEYRRMRAALAGADVGCWRRCGRRATSPDHVPALADHVHVAGSGCCELWPSCSTCNAGAGARLGNRRRRAGARSRLAPGSGWAR